MGSDGVQFPDPGAAYKTCDPYWVCVLARRHSRSLNSLQLSVSRFAILLDLYLIRNFLEAKGAWILQKFLMSMARSKANKNANENRGPIDTAKEQEARSSYKYSKILPDKN